MPDDKQTKPPEFFTAEELAEWRAYKARKRTRDVPGQPPPRDWTPEEENGVLKSDHPPGLGHPDRRAEYLRSLPPTWKQQHGASRPQHHLAFMKALADTGDTSISAKAYLVRRLWRWPDPEIRQAARVALNMLRRKPAARKGIAVARLVKAEIDDRVRQDPFKPVSLTNVYGAVAERLRRDGRKIKDRTVKEYWETWGSSLPWIEAKEQEDLVEKLEAEAKAHRDALFYENAAKWEPEE